jgi:alpha-L-rhamnosidase
MGRWLAYVQSKNPDLLFAHEVGESPGDLLEIGQATDKTLIATTELIYTADALSQMMRHGGLSFESSAAAWAQMAQKARSTFAAAFLLPDGKLKSDTQTAYALAIARGALSSDARNRAGEHLAFAIEREGKHLTTGVLGTAHLLPALSLVGRDDLAYALLLQESCPSWMCSIKNGATTIWERWDGYSKEKGFFADPASNSFSHYALGAVGEWMYDAIGGIALDPAAPAGRHVFVRPRPGGGLTHARARYESVYGPISTDWSREGAAFRLKVSIPPGSRATVTLPFRGKATESGVPLDRATAVKVLESEPAKTVVTVESGAYDFAVAAP